MTRLSERILGIEPFQFKIIMLTTLLLFAALLHFGYHLPGVESQENPVNLPLVINTWAFNESNAAAWHTLTQRPGASALDALVEGCSTCERLQCGFTVGYGGSPDENGDTKLDAMVMDGATMDIGAVAAMENIKNAIGVARMVMEHTHHTLLVGSGATKFAKSMGFQTEDLSTRESRAVWQQWSNSKCQPNFWVDVIPDPRKSCGPYRRSFFFRKDSKPDTPYEVSSSNHDTIGMIVIDRFGQIVAGTSTNGAKFKIPGRVGDSPIPGSGAYADNEVGAAVATGDGDIMMRFAPSLMAVESLRAGEKPKVAAARPLYRILRFFPKFQGALVVVDRFGNYGAACAGMNKFPYSIASGAADAKTRIETVDCLNQIEI